MLYVAVLAFQDNFERKERSRPRLSTHQRKVTIGNCSASQERQISWRLSNVSRQPIPTAGLEREANLPFGAMFHLHSTKKLLDRIKPEICIAGESDTALGNWYATALFWKPQVALLVSEKTLLPVLMPLAPAAPWDVAFLASSAPFSRSMASRPISSRRNCGV